MVGIETAEIEEYLYQEKYPIPMETTNLLTLLIV